MRRVWGGSQVHFTLHVAVITLYLVCKHFLFLYWTNSFTLDFEL